MSTCLISITKLVSGLIIKVRYICIVRNCIIKLNHSILRLTNIQLIKPFSIFSIHFFIKILSQFVVANQLTPCICSDTLSVNTSNTRIIPNLQITSVSFQINSSYTNIFQCTFKSEHLIKYLFTVYKGTIFNP